MTLPSVDAPLWTQHPPGTEPLALAGWFAAMARQLLTGCSLTVAGDSYRLAEIEVYYHAPGHEDPYAHRHPVQRAYGTWYLHRVGSGYRGGTYKGIDLTFGGPDSYSGILIRSLVDANGQRIEGPSLIVDRILHALGCARVAELDRRIGGASAWSAENPVHLAVMASPTEREILATPRVGLGLPRAVREPLAWDFVFRPYRYVAEPRRCRKGKVPVILSRLQAGATIQAIHEELGTAPGPIARYAHAYHEGRAHARAGVPGNARVSSVLTYCAAFGQWVQQQDATDRSLAQRAIRE